MIERQILTGLIVSTEYTQRISDIFEYKYIGSDEIREVTKWCFAYFEEYEKAPGRDIETIYHEKLRQKEIDKDLAEGIEDILSDLSDEYDESFNTKYILDRTVEYFKEQHLQLHSEKVQDLLDIGTPESLEQAETLSQGFVPLSLRISDYLDMSSTDVLLRLRSALDDEISPILTYPGPLGEFWNDQMTRGSLIGILAREKLGKTFLLLDMAMKGVRQRSKVAFFQAGDMTERQQTRRIASYLTKRPIRERQCGEKFLPVADCIRNQMDTCSKRERECGFGVFKDVSEEEVRQEITIEQLKEALELFDDYEPCRNCAEWKKARLGAPWLKKINVPEPVTVESASKKFEEFFIKKKRRLRISTHSNGTLSVEKIRAILKQWDREDGFVPDIILIDYADILITDKERDFRHKQNQIWKDLRGLSQDQNALVIVPTQADASSYKTTLLSLSNFSEDKRKYAHVTAMYGLNQDKENRSREKKIGLLRINGLVIREADFDSISQVTVLQNLTIGRPFLGSYF